MGLDPYQSLPEAKMTHYDGWMYPPFDLLADQEEAQSLPKEMGLGFQINFLQEALDQQGLEAEIISASLNFNQTEFTVKLPCLSDLDFLFFHREKLARTLQTPFVEVSRVSKKAETNEDENELMDAIEDDWGGKGEGVRALIQVPIPMKQKEIIRLKNVMQSPETEDMELPMFLGKAANGEPLVYDLTKLPHMLIAGTSGSGKSVCIHSILMGWLFTKRPDELKLVLVDPKMVEFDMYKAIPHLACPVITKSEKAKDVLQWAVHQMESRYTLLKNANVRNITEYNERGKDPKELCQSMGITNEREMRLTPKKLPYIVVVIDELADLILEEGKDAELPIVQIAQKARAVGIHLIVSTQCPRREVVTGLIKANIPFRVACQMNSALDSRIVIDTLGAECLHGNGHMLIKDGPKLVHGQGAFVSSQEIMEVTEHLEIVAAPQFQLDLVRLDEIAENDEADVLFVLKCALEDPMFDKAVRLLIERDIGSITLLKTRLRLGDTRASRMMEEMRQAGIVGEAMGPGVASDVLIDLAGWEDMKKLVQTEDRSSMLAAYLDESEEEE
ncbi:MAG: FtsK/SpoIIIE domain-containing protein [Planctomycetota bacterium]|nr:FtsK/SpoIIIE domain-containing protein [Planctomycetota bacterium]